MMKKDDPVLNVKFVQLVESHPCLWNSTHLEYSKKEKVQKAWQDIANEMTDTVRNCRDRWRTIRSSFLRSIKIEKTLSGRGKKKYYLAKYLQFLVSFAKRVSVSTDRGASVASTARKTSRKKVIEINVDDTQDSGPGVAIAEDDVEVTIEEDPQPRFAVKTEKASPMSVKAQQNAGINALKPLQDTATIDLNEFAEWVKYRRDNQQPFTSLSSPDGDQSFLNSLHPFIREMTGKQNRRFRQKVIGLIDEILDDADLPGCNNSTTGLSATS